MKIPIFPPVVFVGVPVFLTGFNDILKIAFCDDAVLGFPSKKGPVIYDGIPLVET
jgi:hypothetical protein